MIMECKNVLQILTSADPTDPNYSNAYTHLTQCARCWDLFNQLAQAVVSPLDDEISCAECRDQFATYQQAEIDGLAVGAMYPEVANHLSRCGYCTVEYQALQEVIAADERDELPNLRSTPQFDLSFLQTARVKSFWIQDDENTVRTFFTELVVNLGSSAASFGELPASLMPITLSAAITRTDDDDQPQSLSLPMSADRDVDDAMRIEVTLGMVSKQSTELTITLSQSVDESPLADVRVMLYDAEHNLLSGSMTQANGSILFQNMSVGRYIIQIRHQSERIVLPVLLSAPTRLTS